MATYERYREYATASAADLAANNPVLEAGQLAVESDTGRIKVGNGSTAYTSLSSPTDFTAVWNSSGTTFTGIRFNVTDTASAAGSLLMDLRVGGVSRFRVDKIGNVSVGSATGVGSLAIVPAGGTWPVISRDGGDGGLILGFNSGSASIKLFGTDIAISRDAADTLAQRRGVNAQAFRIYNTFTDASNYERGFVRWGANVLQIGTEKAGTGLARSLDLITDGAVRLSIAAGGDATFSGNLFTNSGAFQMAEITAPAAPAANNVVIYAQDNGSGKTQLMALFATGAAQQIAIEP